MKPWSIPGTSKNEQPSLIKKKVGIVLSLQK